MLAGNPTWTGVLRGMLVLAALWGVGRVRLVDERNGRSLVVA
jgi:hypothetical protein